MNALQALQRGADVLIGQTHGEPFTLHTVAPVEFRAIRRTRYRNVPDLGGVVVELSLVCRRSAFTAVPRAGVDVSASNGERWRVAAVQPGELTGDIEIILEGEQR